MADAAIQACERTACQETCPIHPGHKITSLCKTCAILVCLECKISQTHKEHEFKKIPESLREPTNTTARYLTHIDTNLQITVDRELAAVKQERKERVQKHRKSVKSIKEQKTNFKREIDSFTNSMVVQLDNHLEEVLNLLDSHVQQLELLRKDLTQERNECTTVLRDGYTCLKFDIGNAVKKKVDKIKIPDHPKIPDLQHVKCDKSQGLIRKALGTLQELNLPGTSPSTIAKHSTEDSEPNTVSFDHSEQHSTEDSGPNTVSFDHSEQPSTEDIGPNTASLDHSEQLSTEDSGPNTARLDHSVPTVITTEQKLAPQYPSINTQSEQNVTANQYASINTQSEQKVTAPQYPSINIQSTWTNGDHYSKYSEITPITDNTAWAITNIRNQLHRISNTGQSLQQVCDPHNK